MMPSAQRLAREMANCAPHADSSACVNTASISGWAVSQSSMSFTAGLADPLAVAVHQHLDVGVAWRARSACPCRGRPPARSHQAGDRHDVALAAEILGHASATCSAIVTLLWPMKSVFSDGTSRSRTQRHAGVHHRAGGGHEAGRLDRAHHDAVDARASRSRRRCSAWRRRHCRRGRSARRSDGGTLRPARLPASRRARDG